VLEEESPVLYHNLQNSRVYHEKDKQGIIINQEVKVREGVFSSCKRGNEDMCML